MGTRAGAHGPKKKNQFFFSKLFFFAPGRCSPIVHTKCPPADQTNVPTACTRRRSALGYNTPFGGYNINNLMGWNHCPCPAYIVGGWGGKWVRCVYYAHTGDRVPFVAPLISDFSIRFVHNRPSFLMFPFGSCKLPHPYLSTCSKICKKL